VLDWLDRRDIRWRVYSAGLSLFMLMPKMWPWLLTDRFRSVSRLAYDVQHESQDSFPQVIIVEPDYHDSPVHLSGHGNDNHPPLPVSFGEIFVKAVYEALTSNPARWAKTLADAALRRARRLLRPRAAVARAPAPATGRRLQDGTVRDHRPARSRRC
jgi:phospholipase C